MCGSSALAGNGNAGKEKAAGACAIAREGSMTAPAARALSLTN
jgi:hypothetical protein